MPLPEAEGRPRDTGEGAQGRGRLWGAENSEGDLPLVLWPQIWSRGGPRAVTPWDKGPLQLRGFHGSLDERRRALGAQVSCTCSVA